MTDKKTPLSGASANAHIDIYFVCEPSYEAYAEAEGVRQQTEYEAERRAEDVKDHHRCDCCQLWEDKANGLTACGEYFLCDTCIDYANDDGEVPDRKCTSCGTLVPTSAPSHSSGCWIFCEKCRTGEENNGN